MKIITNKTQRPLSVSLPRGKTLHLGPGKTGQISSKDAEHSPLRKLVEAGSIEILDEAAQIRDETEGGRKRRAAMQGHSWGAGSRRSGDR